MQRLFVHCIFAKNQKIMEFLLRTHKGYIMILSSLSRSIFNNEVCKDTMVVQHDLTKLTMMFAIVPSLQTFFSLCNAYPTKEKKSAIIEVEAPEVQTLW